MGELANPVIVCGSGPSLTNAVRGPGYPLAVISTAIRTIPAPDLWLLVDRINTPHGLQGVEAAKNPDVKKIVPEVRVKVHWGDFPNVEGVHQTPEGPKHGSRTFLDGKGGTITGTNLHRSMLFAIQVLSARFGTLIFAGCDMSTKKGVLYSHGYVYPQKHKHRPQKSRINSVTHQLGLELRRWAEWAPIAKEKGVTWLSWTEVSPINDLMERFTWTPSK